MKNDHGRQHNNVLHLSPSLATRREHEHRPRQIGKAETGAGLNTGMTEQNATHAAGMDGNTTNLEGDQAAAAGDAAPRRHRHGRTAADDRLCKWLEERI